MEIDLDMKQMLIMHTASAYHLIWVATHRQAEKKRYNYQVHWPPVNTALETYSKDGPSGDKMKEHVHGTILTLYWLE